MDFLANSVTAIIGPSGCGKSTVLRSINRMHDLTPVSPGRGQDPARRARHLRPEASIPVAIRRRVGMVFQKPNPFPAMSIYDNVIAGYRLNGRVKTAKKRTRSSNRASSGWRSGTRSRTA